MGNLNEVVDMLYELFNENKEKWRLNEIPLVLFGHSYGAILAFELTRKLQHFNDIIVAKLILSAARNPGDLTQENLSRDEPCHHKQSDDELFHYLTTIGGKHILLCIRCSNEANGLIDTQFANEL